MKIAVAGGAGFIGQHLVSQLVKDGHEVRASYFTKRARIKSDCQWMYLNLANRLEAELLVGGADTVYICAGETAGAGVVAKTRRALVIPTILLHVSLFEACARAGVKKIIAMSSSTAYPDSDQPMKETDYEGPLFHQYRHIGATKRFVETFGRMYEEMDVTFLRVTNAYGPHDCYNLQRSHVIPALVRKVVEKHDPLTIWGDGGEVRDLIYIDDVVRALVLAQKSTGHESYNIGLGAGISVNDALAILLELSGYRPQVVYDASKPQMIRKRAVDVTKAREMLGFTATIQPPAGLWTALAWARENL